jgi:hypothetical protein
MDAIWDVVTCKLLDNDQTSRGAYRGAIALMMEAVSTCEMPVNTYQTTRHSIPEDSQT